VIPNQRLIEISGRSTTALEAFLKADEVLLQAVRGISQIITEPGLINVDFADVRTIMAEMGMAMMGAGIGRGDNRACDAAAAAISSPLLEDVSIGAARGVLINITASSDFGIHEMDEAIALIQNESHEDANIIFGLVHDPRLDDEVRITVIATGVGDQMSERPAGRARRATTTTHQHHSYPTREPPAPAPRSWQQQAALHLPLIDDRIEDAPPSGARDPGVTPPGWRFPAVPGMVTANRSTSPPVRRWPGRPARPPGALALGLRCIVR
jgi:cell division protein FtsZ